ncbi:SpoIIE family protein phosphatase [Streptomyces lavendulae]|uniref:SpoIIE family protein phosphatase n=1 Tax=Streptomyces lavendulae TaxID=1914 RepID=UPI00381C0247
MVSSGNARPGQGPPRDPAVAVLDDDGVVTSWGPGAQRLLGYPAREIVGRSALDLLAPCADAGGWLQRLRARGGAEGDVVLRARDGRTVSVTGRVHRLSDSAGHHGWLALADGTRPGPGIARHEEIAARSPVAMAILDEELRYVWLNDALVHGGGVSREESLGRRWGDLQPGLETDDARDVMRRVMETGEPMVDHEYFGRTRADPGHKRAFSMSAFRLDASADAGPALVFLVLDATDRWRARERLALLNEAGARIGTTLDVVRTAQELADVAVPRLADAATVDVLDWVLGGAVDLGASSGSLVRAGRQSARTGVAEPVIGIGSPVPCRPSSPAGRCLAGEGAFLEPASGAAGGTVMTLPLRARGVVLGVAAFARWAPAVPFEEDDLVLAQEVVSRAAVCLDNARRYTRERATALALQRGLLLRHLPESATLEVSSLYLPADAHHGVGGDWVDVIPLSGARTALVVGDVAGHGIQAAATMGRLRSGVHALAALDVPPDELLAHLDDLVTRLADETPAGSDGPAATCLYLVYDPVGRHCVMARAGHPPPGIVSPSGAFALADLPAGPPLGVGGLPFESAAFDLPDGTVIALYTDGLLEAHEHDPDTGVERLAEELSHPPHSLDGLCGRVVDTLRTGPQRDDIAVLLARTHGLAPHQFVSWDLPGDPALVARARALATEQLDAWGLGDLRPDMALVVSELVTNAIRYGSEPIRLRLIHHHTLICEVSDGSNTAPHLRHARTTDEGGRGLFLVAQVTDRWGTRHSGVGKTIWAELDLPASAGGHRREGPQRSLATDAAM